MGEKNEEKAQKEAERAADVGTAMWAARWGRVAVREGRDVAGRES